MMGTLELPQAFAKAPITDQLRYLARALKVGDATLAVTAALEEAATEIDMGRSTRLTYRGRETGR